MTNSTNIEHGTWAAIVAAGLLVGCAPPSPALLRAEGSGPVVAEMPGDVSAVYERLARQVRACYTSADLGPLGQARGEAEWLPASGWGQAWASEAGQVWWTITVRPAGPGRVRLEGWYYLHEHFVRDPMDRLVAGDALCDRIRASETVP